MKNKQGYVFFLAVSAIGVLVMSTWLSSPTCRFNSPKRGRGMRSIGESCGPPCSGRMTGEDGTTSKDGREHWMTSQPTRMVVLWATRRGGLPRLTPVRGHSGG